MSKLTGRHARPRWPLAAAAAIIVAAAAAPAWAQPSRPVRAGAPDAALPADVTVDAWTSLQRRGLPPALAGIQAPLSYGNEITWHGMSADIFPAVFDWLAVSGYWPEWIDTYSVGGATYYNHIWRPAQAGWRAYYLLTRETLLARFNEAIAQGYRPVQVESSRVGNDVRYSIIMRRNTPGDFIARQGLTYDQHLEILEQAMSKGLSPVNISVVSINGNRRYTVLYRSEGIGQWQMRSRIPTASYQALYDENARAGRRPSYVNAYLHNGQTFFTVVFSQLPAGARIDRHGLTASEYEAASHAAHELGRPIRAVSGYDGAQSNHRYIAIWRR